MRRAFAQMQLEDFSAPLCVLGIKMERERERERESDMLVKFGIENGPSLLSARPSQS